MYPNQNYLSNMGVGANNKSQNNYLNYKIVKCKNWEKDEKEESDEKKEIKEPEKENQNIIPNPH